MRSHEHDIVFIDASRDFEPGKKQGQVRDEDVNKIIETYRARAVLERYSHTAMFEEIEANGFNLNIPRYVDTFEPEEEIDVAALQKEINTIEAELAVVRSRMAA